MQEKLIQKANFVNKFYPLYSGLNGGLVFYVVINTIWLTTVKGFDSLQVILLEVCISLSIRFFLAPILNLVKRIGNTWAIRLGSLTLLATSILLTFGQEYWVFIIAMILQSISLMLTAMRDILIQNNLSFLHRGQEYVKVASRAHFVYSVTTMIGALLSGPLFAVWQYLPMLLGVLLCAIGCIMSFWVVDVSEIANHHPEETLPANPNKLTMPHPAKLLLSLFIFCALTYGLAEAGQTNIKLLLQYQLEDQLSIDKMVFIVSAVWFLSRLLQLFTDLAYPKLYQLLRNKIPLLLSVGVAISYSLILISLFSGLAFNVKVILMSIGFAILPTIRDPLHIFCQNIILKRADKEDRRDALVYLVLIQQAGKFVLSLLSSLMLLFLPLQYTIIIFAIVVIPALSAGIRLTRLTKIAHHH